MTEEEMKSGRFHNANQLPISQWIEWDPHVMDVAKDELAKVVGYVSPADDDKKGSRSGMPGVPGDV